MEGNLAGWPVDLPSSKASKVGSLDSVIVKADVERWAAGFRGPCLMTQNWWGCGGEYPEGARFPDWDTLRITSQVDPMTGGLVPDTRDVDIKLVDQEPDEESHNAAHHGLTCLFE